MVGKATLVSELNVARFGEPRRHEARLRHGSNLAAVFLDVLIGEKRERASFAGPMARSAVVKNNWRDIAIEGTIVTQAEIEAAFRKKNEKIKIEYVRLTADKYKGESQPTAAPTPVGAQPNLFG